VFPLEGYSEPARRDQQLLTTALGRFSPWPVTGSFLDLPQDVPNGKEDCARCWFTGCLLQERSWLLRLPAKNSTKIILDISISKTAAPCSNVFSVFELVIILWNRSNGQTKCRRQSIAEHSFTIT